MKKQKVKQWRLEATNPDQALWGLDKDDPRTAWKRLWGFDEDEQTAYQGLIEELNQINAPVIVRIVRNSD
jgi:hypothetical protein